MFILAGFAECISFEEAGIACVVCIQSLYTVSWMEVRDSVFYSFFGYVFICGRMLACKSSTLREVHGVRGQDVLQVQRRLRAYERRKMGSYYISLFIVF